MQEEQRVCVHCGRVIIVWQERWFHATPWERKPGTNEGTREIYLHCRRQVAKPLDEGAEIEDDVEREAHLTAYFRGGDTDWEHPDVETAAGFVAFRAGWKAARS